MKRLFRLAAAWVSLVVLASGCAGASPAAPAAPSGGGNTPAPATSVRRLTAAVQGDPKTLSQSVNASGAGSVPGVDAIEHMLNVGLVIFDATGKLQPRLAEAVPSTDNGLWTVAADGSMQLTWKIREGATWHDGTPVTSEDVLFTAKVDGDRDTPALRESSYPASFATSARIEAPDSRTVVVRWSRPYIQADEMFRVLLPKHLLEGPYTDDKANMLNLPYWTDGFVGTGPFKLTEFVRGSQLVTRAFDGYVMGRPKIDEVTVKFIPDSNTLLADILAGQIDVTLGRTLSLDQGLQVRNRWSDGKVDIVDQTWVALFPQFIDPNPAILADVQFRRALMNAVDRQALVDQLMAGASAVADGYISPKDPAYSAIAPGIVRYPYDPARAAQIIQSLGYTKGADGFFRSAAGDKLSVEIRAGSSLDIQTKSMLSTADYWQRTGIGVDQVTVPPQQASDRKYRATRPGFEIVRQPNDVNAVTRVRSSDSPLPENDYTGANRSRYQSAELEGLIDRYQATIPLPDRLSVLQQIVHHMTDQVVWMGLFYDVEPTMISNRVQNVTARKESSSQAWNAQDWTVTG
jgi:peptide/nickel transport system substrate-binding protein